MSTPSIRALTLGLGTALSFACGGAAPTAVEPAPAPIEEGSEPEATPPPLTAGATYYTVRRDVRRCAYPMCGGVWLRAVNGAATTCADGSTAEECYAAELAFSTEQASLRDEILGGAELGRVVLRGGLEARAGSEPVVIALAVSEAWIAPGALAPSGELVHVVDNGIRCITAPCRSLREATLNASATEDIAGLDLTAPGATDADREAMGAALASPAGVVVAGARGTVSGAGGDAPTREASAFWVRRDAR